jgi:hypothetical protein
VTPALGMPCSIQLSYGRSRAGTYPSLRILSSTNPPRRSFRASRPPRITILLPVRTADLLAWAPLV